MTDHEKRIREALAEGSCLVTMPELRALLADLDEARSALTAAKAGGWVPIESAPKDSTARLVWCPERQNIYAVTWLPKVGWVIFGGRALSELPTKWQPLPNPPKEQGK